jgi:hypothetical protein
VFAKALNTTPDWFIGGAVTNSSDYEINLWWTKQGDLWLRYSLDGEPIHLAISMTSSKLHSGGRRCWSICPVTVSVLESCTFPMGRQFVGRKAYDPTYTSCRESGRAKRMQRRIDGCPCS